MILSYKSFFIYKSYTKWNFILIPCILRLKVCIVKTERQPGQEFKILCTYIASFNRIIFYRLLHLKLPIFLESHNFAKTVYFFQNLLQAIQARGVSIMPIKKAQDDDDDEPKKVGVLSLVRAPTKFSIVNNF